MDLLDEETLVSPSTLPMPIFKKLVTTLNTNNAWEIVAEYFSFFSEEEIKSIKVIANPAEYVLNELGIRLCTIRMLCIVLEQCELYGALMLFKNHKPVIITQQPTVSGDNNTCMILRHNTLRLNCMATGFPPPKYQWYLGNESISNATKPWLEIECFNDQDEGEYVCYVSQEGYEGVFTQVVTANLAPELPLVTKQPPSQLVCRMGSLVSIMVEAEGHPKVKYQWYKGTYLLDGATYPELKIDGVTENDEGSYRCYMSNCAGELWSGKCQLTVYVSPEDVEQVYKTRPIASAKVALLIGNQQYRNMDPLSTPEYDVKTLADIFKQHGFSVIALQNLTLNEMRATVREFCKILPKGAYVVFYFAGHGFKLSDKYMLPIDAPSPNYLTSHALSEGEFLHDVLATSPQVLFQLLDMCLNLPDEENKAIFEERSTLHKYHANNNLIQGYSTSSHHAAYEKRTDANGLFVKFLQKYLLQDILMMLILEKVAQDMEKEYPLQRPYRGTNVTREFRLTDPCKKNTEVESKVGMLMNVPDIQVVKLMKRNEEYMVHFSPYLGVFCNTLQITFANLSRYSVSCATKLDVIIERLGNDIIVTVRDVQRFEENSFLVLDLMNRSDGSYLDQIKWPLGKPLIRISDLWSDKCPQHDVNEPPCWESDIDVCDILNKVTL